MDTQRLMDVEHLILSNQLMTNRQLAEITGYSIHQITRFRRMLGYPSPHRSQRLTERNAKIVRLAIEQQLTISELSTQFGITRQRVSQILHRAGYSLAGRQYQQLGRRRKRDHAAAMLRTGASVEDTMATYGYHDRTHFRKMMKAAGYVIPSLRSASGQHGSPGMYNRGCRCQACRDVWNARARAYQRGWRARRKAQRHAE
jgi:AraC-like DNA-binding protein